MALPTTLNIRGDSIRAVQFVTVEYLGKGATPFPPTIITQSDVIGIALFPTGESMRVRAPPKRVRVELVS